MVRSVAAAGGQSLASICALAVATATGCGSRSEAVSDNELVVVRVAAPYGLASFVPGPRMRGSSTSVADLLYELMSDHAAVASREGSVVVLRLNEVSSLSSAQLAQLIVFEGTVSARAIDDRHVRVELADAATADAFIGSGVVDTGPFALEKQTATQVRLVRRSRSAIDVIEVVKMSTDQEFIELHGRSLDVIPFAEEIRRKEFEDLYSVRLIEIDGVDEISLFMNTTSRWLRDPQVRRLISRSLDRRAIAKVVCESDRCVARHTRAPMPHNVAIPKTLSLLVHPGDGQVITASKVVRHQLREKAGIEVEITERDLTAGIELWTAENTDLILAPLPMAEHRYQLFVSPERNARLSFTGYANEQYDQAVAAGKFDVAQALLDRDVPVTPLYVPHFFAVIDNRFCGDVTPDGSWAWLADLRPCGPGETP